MARGEDPVQVPSRTSGRRVGLPRRLEGTAVAETHQYRVQGAGLEPELLTQLVPMTPLALAGGELRQDGQGLGGGATGHATTI